MKKNPMKKNHDEEYHEEMKKRMCLCDTPSSYSPLEPIP